MTFFQELKSEFLRQYNLFKEDVSFHYNSTLTEIHDLSRTIRDLHIEVNEFNKEQIRDLKKEVKELYHNTKPSSLIKYLKED